MITKVHIVVDSSPLLACDAAAIDSLNILKALKQTGIGIHLHCLASVESTEIKYLNELCSSLEIYNTFPQLMDASLNHLAGNPVVSRAWQNLHADEYPVLVLSDVFAFTINKTPHKKTIYRSHKNINQQLCSLAASETNVFKQFLYNQKRKSLAKYNAQLSLYDAIATTTSADHFQTTSTQQLIPPFVPWQKVEAVEGKGSYCFYHGDLSDRGNEYSVKWLLKKVFSKIKLPLVVAGKNPSKELTRLMYKNDYTCIIANPSRTELDDLIRRAQVNVLPAVCSSGSKLKLINSLFFGRHIIANDKMVAGTGLSGTCIIANTAEEFIKEIKHKYHLPFLLSEINTREKLLAEKFNVNEQVNQLIGLLEN